MFRGGYPSRRGSIPDVKENGDHGPNRAVDPHPEPFEEQCHPSTQPTTRAPPFPAASIPARSSLRPGPWGLSSHMDPGPSQRSELAARRLDTSAFCFSFVGVMLTR